MSEEPLTPRPAATVMLVRDTADGIKVFLMRRHSAMEFVAGVMVFPGGGVDIPRIPAGSRGPLVVVRGFPASREPRATSGSAAAVGELGDAEGGAHPSLRHLLLCRGIAGRPA